MSEDIIDENADYQLILPKDEMKGVEASAQKRVVAFFVDLLIVFIAFVIPFVTTFSMFSGIVSTDIVALEQFIYDNYFIIASMEISVGFIMLIYFVFSEKLLGYTIGKRFFNLNVGEITYFQAFIRNITKAFVFTTPFIALADFIWMFFNPGRRRLTEIIARTKVLYEPRLEVEYRWQEEL